MPLRPFPHPFSIGTDICHISRFRKFIKDANTRPRFLKLFDKVLLPAEQKEFWTRFGDYDGFCEMNVTGVGERNRGVLNWIAGRWAAKEAIIKSNAPNSRLHFRDIEIRYHPTRQPYGIIHDEHPSQRTSSSSEQRPGYISAERIYSSWRQSQLPKSEDAQAVTSKSAVKTPAATTTTYTQAETMKTKRTEETTTKQKAAKLPRIHFNAKEIPTIISKDGTLDLGAVERALKGGDALSSVPSPDTATSSESLFQSLSSCSTTDSGPFDKHSTSPSSGRSTTDTLQPPIQSSSTPTSTQSPPQQTQTSVEESSPPSSSPSSSPTSSSSSSSPPVPENNPKEEINGQIVQLSISHDGDYCIATAMSPILVDASSQGRRRERAEESSLEKRTDMRRLRRSVGTLTVGVDRSVK